MLLFLIFLVTYIDKSIKVIYNFISIVTQNLPTKQLKAIVYNNTLVVQYVLVYKKRLGFLDSNCFHSFSLSIPNKSMETLLEKTPDNNFPKNANTVLTKTDSVGTQKLPSTISQNL